MITQNKTEKDTSKIPPELFKKIRRIEFRTKKMINDIVSGKYNSLFRGYGMEFEDVREYFPGDDYRRIDWNVTARHGKPYVKRFHEERQLNVSMLIDISGSSDYGSLDQSKGEKIAEMAALLAFTALSNQDKIGSVLFTDAVEKYISPTKNRNTVLRMIRDILYHRSDKKGTNIDIALQYALDNMKRRGIIFVFSDYFCHIDPKRFIIASKKHDLIPVIVTDKFEYALSGPGLINAVDNETGRTLLIDTRSRAYRRFIEERSYHLTNTELFFKQLGIEPIVLDCADDIERVLVEYFARRSKRYRN